MLEDLFSDDITMAAVAALVIAVLVYLIPEKGSKWFNFDDNLNKIKKADPLDNGPSQSLTKIFYMYNHKSEREWMEWIRQQNKGIKGQAIKLLNDHFDSPAKYWGPITEEALGTMPAFKDEGAEHVIAKFFIRVGKLWGEYKSIPNLYKRAANVLAIMSPQVAVKCFSDELDRKSNIQFELERKKIIIEALPKVGTLGIGLMTNIIINNLEVFANRTHALRTAEKFEGSDYQRVVIECLKHQIKRFANHDRKIEEEEEEIVEDLFTAAARYISDKEFVSVFQFACQAGSTIHQHALKPLIKRVKAEKTNLGFGELYAMTLLKDNKENDLRRAIAAIHELEEDEIRNIIITELREEPITEEALFAENPNLCPTPIPRPYEKDFSRLVKLYEPPTMISQHPCQKTYGGVLVTGDDELEKIYFARSFADSRELNFGHINIANINNKEDYNQISKIFTELRKPYFLYIEHPELMYPSDKSQAANYRIKFAQTLYAQALDTKSFLFGSIKQKARDIESETTLAAVQELRSNFFAQVFEINKKDDGFKSAILEDCFMSIAPHRIGNRPELAHSIIDKYKSCKSLEFCFEALKLLSTSLLVYGRSVAIEEIEKLRARFTIELKGKLNNIKQKLTES